MLSLLEVSGVSQWPVRLPDHSLPQPGGAVLQLEAGQAAGPAHALPAPHRLGALRQGRLLSSRPARLGLEDIIVILSRFQ